MKKLLAVLLSLCLVVGMLPMMAFAVDEEDGTNGEVNDITNSQVDEVVKKTEQPTEDFGSAADNVQSVSQLKEVLDGSETEIHIGASMDLTDNLTISRDVLIKGGPFNGPGKIIINADVKFVDVVVNTDVEVAENKTLTLSGTSNINKDKISGEGKVVGTSGDVIYDGTNTGTDNPGGDTGTEPGDGDDDEQEVPVEPVYYSVSFDVTPYWADVVVTDSTGNTVKPDRNGQYWLEAGKEYDYTVSAYGFISETGDIGLTNAIKVKLDQSDKVIVWPTSHGDVYFSYLRHGVVAVYVEPDSGYYLDDLTIYRVGYGAIDYGKWDNGVYYFRMKPGAQYIIDADFAAAPSEYRVYVDSSILHGDVSVDTVYAEEGEWVYITVDPDVGYRLYNLTVTRPSGNTVKVEHVRDNVYRFSMPGVRVTVDAEFIRTVTPFTDVRLADWFYEYVSFAYRYGLMEGINSYQFAPDATATRAMVVQILYRMSGEPAVSYGSGFTDVASNAWYADAIAWAARNNIVNGTGAATFDPNAPVTREQFATMLYRYARYRGFNTSLTANILSYYDVNQVSEYAFEALQWACAEGIVNGTSTGYLTPQGNATRAQLAAMLMRFCNEYFDL